MVIKLGVEEWVGTGTSFVGKETLRCFMAANNWHSWNCIEYHHDLVKVNQNTTIVVVTTSTKKERNWSFNTFSISLNIFYISQITSFVLLTLFNFNVKRYCVLPFLLLVYFPFLNRLFVKVVTIYWINQYGSTDIIYLWICCWLKSNEQD